MEDICVEWICPKCNAKNTDRAENIIYDYVFCAICDATVTVTFEIEVKNVNVEISS